MTTNETITQAVHDLFHAAQHLSTDTHSIEHLVQPDEPIVLYGAGGCLATFSISILEKYPLNIVAVLDKKIKGVQQWNGISLCSPDSYKIPQNVKSVIVTIGKKQLLPDIEKMLLQMGFEKVIFAINIYQFHTMFFPIELEKEKHLYFRKYADQIIKAGNMLHDSESRDVFLSILKTYILRIPQEILCHPAEEQYFPYDLFGKKTYQRTIHCGAYHGENILLLNKYFGKMESVVCIEGSIENYSIMQEKLLPIKNDIADELLLIPCLISDKISTVQFMQDGIVSRHSQKAETVLTAVSLDSLFMNFSPTYITMDIEGSEKNAIEGCKKLIKSRKPSLAISIYHTPSHLWEIILKLNEYCPEYKFAIRNYTGLISDTILYAFT